MQTRGQLIALAAVLIIAAACNGPAATSSNPANSVQPREAEDYVRTYGGNADEYRAILGEATCTALQDRLYVATDNEAYGYQTAIMDRGHVLGCPEFQLTRP